MADLTSLNYWPLGSTVQESMFSVDKKAYRHFGFISVNLINGHMVVIYRLGQHHVLTGDYGVICIKHSIDGGTNWTDETILFSQSNVDLRNLGGGYDSTGRLFLFYIWYCPDSDPNLQITPHSIKMVYRFSDTDGSSWHDEIELPTNNCLGYSPHGQLTDIGNGILFQTWYDSNGIYLYKSINGGQTFNSIITLQDSYGYNEASMIHVGGGCLILLVRTSTPGRYAQFKSEDSGNNWFYQNYINLSSTLAYPSPPWLNFINYEGVGIVVCYFTNRYTQKLYAVYGLAKDSIKNNETGWNLNTLKQVYDYSGTIGSGYQSFYQPNNQYKGIGISFKETVEYSKAHPVIIFSNIDSMKNTLINLGL